MAAKSAPFVSIAFLSLSLASCGFESKATSGELMTNGSDAGTSCFDPPVDQCTADGCQLFSAYPYNAFNGCYQHKLEPAFCKPLPDIECFWEGDPILMTSPDGAAWYFGSSCFSTPPNWTVEYFSDGKRRCITCLDFPVDQCTADRCQLFSAYPYDALNGCYQDELEPAFCKPLLDIECFWEGDPILMTSPDGSAWYFGSSCFSTPPNWTIEYFPDGKPECGS
jgi:hypothetical protein